MIDDTAGYHPRAHALELVAGVGMAGDGRELAWNLVEGDQRRAVGQRAHGLGRRRAARGAAEQLRRRTLSSVDELRFHPEAELRNDQNLLLDAQRLPAAVRHASPASCPVA